MRNRICRQTHIAAPEYRTKFRRNNYHAARPGQLHAGSVSKGAASCSAPDCVMTLLQTCCCCPPPPSSALRCTLVVFTGDNEILDGPPNPDAYLESMRQLTKPLVDAQVPWMTTFGNRESLKHAVCSTDLAGYSGLFQQSPWLCAVGRLRLSTTQYLHAAASPPPGSAIMMC